ncbi:MAG: hypothetical protein WC364_10545 [Eubacteriales bacterium]|jgi:hypothetical protein
MPTLKPYTSKRYLVVGENHGKHVSNMGVTRYINDILTVCDTPEEAEAIVKQKNSPVSWKYGVIEPREKVRVTQEAYC